MVEIVNETDKYAIYTRKLCFSYTSGLNKKPILNCVDISVPQGIIYGLLGPSGCGKTSLLKAIIGLIKPDAGFISVFGHKPGTKASGVPGPGVGYMPQDIALNDYLSVSEVFNYFGKVYLKSDAFINEKKKYFLRLLDLKDEDANINSLSGGQQRRLSLAVAVFTEPRLLILDEPTVGVDPLLCETIWKFLKKIVTEKQITIIVTTHYIEEMKSASKVAFMRNGEILKEETPMNVMQNYQKTSLEDVFYYLSYDQKQRKCSLLTKKEVRRVSHEVAVRDSVMLFEEPLQVTKNWFSANLIIISVLVWKGLIQSYRDMTAFVIFIIPIFIIFLATSCLGRSPTNVQLGWVVDDDYGSYAFSTSKLTPDLELETDDKYPYLPDIFHKEFNGDFFNLKEYETVQEAIADAKKLKLAGVVYLPVNFSENFYARDIYISEEEWVDNSTIQSGSVHLWLDFGNSLFSTLVHREIIKIVTNFRKTAYEAIGINSNVSQLPMKIIENIHGFNVSVNDYSQTTRFYSFGFFVAILFGAAMVSGSNHFHCGYSGDYFTRAFSAGIKAHQIIIANTIALFLLSASSAVLSLFFMIYALNIECRGNVIFAVIDVSLSALCGSSAGILFAQIFPTTFLCHVFGTGYLIGLIMISGVVWPAEAMPYFMRFISETSPLSAPLATLSKIMNYEHVEFVTYILPGFCVSIIYTILNSFQSWLVLIRKR